MEIAALVKMSGNFTNRTAQWLLLGEEQMLNLRRDGFIDLDLTGGSITSCRINCIDRYPHEFR